MDTILKLVGAATLAVLSYKFIDAASLWLLPPISLSRYQQRSSAGKPTSWALITGASAGIGLGCAVELALRGFSVILLGHKPSELEEAKASILAEASVEVKLLVLDATRASASEIDAALDSISHLPLGVLVNNLGGMVVDPKKGWLHAVDEFSGQELDDSLALSARFMMQASRKLIPSLKQHALEGTRTRSLIINISSFAHVGMPLLATYSGCKGFINAFTTSMARDFISKGVNVDAIVIVPGDVRSQSNTTAPPSAPDGRQFAKAIMNKVSRAVDKGWIELAPIWSQAAGVWVIKAVLPETLGRRALYGAISEKRDIFLRSLTKED
ncbi:hypothetical protein B0H63DRAFT_219439 [Podospora didyma]|uniref:NAD(P)-binding protein n=1 Tax=Podospora didyma TaxID=330526 RepID=A0AAE0KKD2_9PEZI|nr:hypothetical protein B0H63DRAFT_219439 [Podospora didyma]